MYELPTIKTEIVTEGKKIFRKFSVKEEGNWKKFKFTTGGKGWHIEKKTCNAIVEKKIELLSDYARSVGATDFRFSNTTKSIYFELNDISFRISDHEQKAFEGISFIVKWNSTGKDFKDLIDLFNLK